MIDIIIPAFNAHETIETTLSSLALQVAREYMTITIVNDNGNDYKEIVSRFKDRLNIKELKKRVNGGAGLARQHGIDNTSNPYIAFVDADDLLPNIFTLSQQFAYLMQHEKCIAISGNFLEETPNGSYVAKTNDMTWLHGKMYRRSHLVKHGIHFSELRLCEDVEFNIRVKLNADKDEYVHYMTDMYYYVWKNFRQSITRVDVDKFPYLDIVIAGVEASYRALKETYGEHKDRFKRGEVMSKVMNMFDYYVLMTIEKFDKVEWLEELLLSFKKFWNNLAKEVYENAPENEIANLFNNRDRGNSAHLIPNITLFDFIKILNNNDDK